MFKTLFTEEKWARCRKQAVMISSGSSPKALQGGSMDDDDLCEAHHTTFAGHPHPDGMHKPTHLPEHKRGAGHPARHTKGKLPAQLNPDHGMHKGAGKHA